MDEPFYPPSVKRLIEELGGLPGIGRRGAERLAFHILALPRAEAMRLAVAVRDVKNNLRACARCFNVAEGELCAVCANPRRDAALLCVVELPRDVIAMEKTGAYHGVYHVLQGRLAPADGVGPDRLRIAELRRRLTEAAAADSPVREVVLATNPTAEGDATAHFLAELLRGGDKDEAGGWPPPRVTRLARGLSAGAELESVTPSVLHFALTGRQTIDEDAP